MRGIAAIVIGLMFTACAFDPAREKRPARLLLGANARGLAGSTASNIAARGEVAAPTSTPEVASGAITGSGQFTMRYGRVLRLGIELEEGRLDTAGSNYAGAYGVVGAEHASGAGTIGVELVSGWRGLRKHLGDEDLNTIVAEPRARAQYRLGEQLTVGAVLGATIGERGSWMGGVYLGFDSHAFGGL